MNSIIKINKYCSILFGILVLSYSQMATAACSRDDIDHYLKNGFTPTQITQICAEPNTDTAVSAEPKADIQKQQSTESSTKKQVSISGTAELEAQMEQSLLFLNLSIKAKELHFLDEEFYYIAKECIEYDPQPKAFESRIKKYCGLVRTSIAYQDMAAVDRELLDLKLFRSPSVLVEGSIYREALDKKKLDRLTKHERKLLNKRLGKVEQVAIPVQNSTSLDRVKAELNKLAK